MGQRSKKLECECVKEGNKNKAWVITKAKQHRFGSIECFLVWKLKKKNRKEREKRRKKRDAVQIPNSLGLWEDAIQR